MTLSYASIRHSNIWRASWNSHASRHRRERRVSSWNMMQLVNRCSSEWKDRSVMRQIMRLTRRCAVTLSPLSHTSLLICTYGRTKQNVRPRMWRTFCYVRTDQYGLGFKVMFRNTGTVQVMLSLGLIVKWIANKGLGLNIAQILIMSIKERLQVCEWAQLRCVCVLWLLQLLQVKRLNSTERSANADHPNPPPHPLRYVHGDWMYDLSWWLGFRGGETHVWPADWQIHTGQLYSALGLHPGHNQHHGLPHSLLPGLQPGKQAGQPAPRGLPGGGERYQSEGRVGERDLTKKLINHEPNQATGTLIHLCNCTNGWFLLSFSLTLLLSQPQIMHRRPVTEADRNWKDKHMNDGLDRQKNSSPHKCKMKLNSEASDHNSDSGSCELISQNLCLFTCHIGCMICRNNLSEDSEPCQRKWI